ncbi:MAG: hypothetical protein IIB36_12785 [Gemmatimonadetes bacterium]|nr:hypothetical protein [Gemmatimonadota bacterium]
MSVRVSAARPLLTVILLGLLAGCRTWQPATVSPERLIAEQRPSSVRVTVSGGATITLKHPLIINDSIVSSEAPAAGATFVPPRLGVLSGDVRSLEVARFSPVRTIALIATIAAVSVGWARAAGGSRGGSTVEPGLPKGLALLHWGGLQLVWGLFR